MISTLVRLSENQLRFLRYAALAAEPSDYTPGAIHTSDEANQHLAALVDTLTEAIERACT